VPGPGRTGRFAELDGLRGIAILLVVLGHSFYINPNRGAITRFIGGVMDGGAWGVTLFFALSGFLIALPFWRQKLEGRNEAVPSRYGWTRFWKIYPPFALSILVLAPIYVARTGHGSYLTVAAQWLAGWPLVHPVNGQFNPVLWTLIIEVHFYLLMPLLFVALKKVSYRSSLWIVFLVVGLGPLACRWWYLGQGRFLRLEPEISVLFPSQLDSFAGGVLLAGIHAAGRVKKSWARLGTGGCLLFLLAVLVRGGIWVRPLPDAHYLWEVLGCLAKIASGLMLCCVCDPDCLPSRLLAAPWLRWFGLISYEWYLIHQPLTLWARELGGPAGGQWTKYLFIIGGSGLLGLVLAALFYRYFSLPILRWARARACPGREVS